MKPFGAVSLPRCLWSAIAPPIRRPAPSPDVSADRPSSLRNGPGSAKLVRVSSYGRVQHTHGSNPLSVRFSPFTNSMMSASGGGLNNICTPAAFNRGTSSSGDASTEDHDVSAPCSRNSPSMRGNKELCAPEWMLRPMAICVHLPGFGGRHDCSGTGEVPCK